MGLWSPSFWALGGPVGVVPSHSWAPEQKSRTQWSQLRWIMEPNGVFLLKGEAAHFSPSAGLTAWNTLWAPARTMEEAGTIGQTAPPPGSLPATGGARGGPRPSICPFPGVSAGRECLPGSLRPLVLQSQNWETACCWSL